MPKRCIDGCRWKTKRWEKHWCDCTNEPIANTGRYCKNYEKATPLQKFKKWLFDD